MASRLTFKTLTVEQKEWMIRVLFSKESTIRKREAKVASKFGIHPRTVWSWRRKIKQELDDNRTENPYMLRAQERRSQGGDYYIFTWAQNATIVHDEFWENLLAYAEFIGAEVHVIPGRYRNPSLMYSQGKVERTEWWDDTVLPYLNTNREEIHPGVVFMGDIKIQPTAVNPMSGLQSFAGDSTAIFGHPKVQLQSMPNLPGHRQAIHLTTGACTVRNYSDTKAGKKGEHHHMLGFVLLEAPAEGPYHVRQVTATREGSFIDLFWEVNEGRVTPITECKAFVMGDIHLAQVEERVVDLTLDYLDRVRPEATVIHDVFDGVSVNHHEAANPFSAYARMQKGNHVLLDEVNAVMEFLRRILPYRPVLAYSNHCEWIDRWLASEDWRKDIVNAATYLRYAHILLTEQPEGGILHYLVDEEFGDEVITLGPNSSMKVGPWEIANHGHMGVNGSRGGMNGFRKFNTKVIFAHFHSAARYEGAVQVGTFTRKDMGYNKGPSSWTWCGAVVHTNDKVQQLIFTEDEHGRVRYTTLQPGN